jgi:hypothetical protein
LHLSLIVAIALAVSCKEKAPPSDTSATGSVEDAAPTKAANAAKASSSDPDKVVPPKDAQWTLYCYIVTGPVHVEQARQLKANLVQNSQLKQWHVIHGENESTLYYGFYRSINDPKDTKESNRAQAERKKVATLTDARGDRPFANAFFVELSAPDPNAPPEWDLRNAPGYWSVEVAVYKGSMLRKQAAVDAVREARKQGVQAYYYHGENSSSVCIGAWPQSAVRELEQDPSTATKVNPSEDVIVTPFPVPGVGSEVRTPEGGVAKTVAPRNQIVDPTLIKVLQDYPNHAINGDDMVKIVRDPKTGAQKQVADRSFIVRIPERSDGLLSSGGGLLSPGADDGNPSELTMPGGDTSAQPVQSQQKQEPPKPGVGKLKSIGG